MHKCVNGEHFAHWIYYTPFNSNKSSAINQLFKTMSNINQLHFQFVKSVNFLHYINKTLNFTIQESSHLDLQRS